KVMLRRFAHDLARRKFVISDGVAILEDPFITQLHPTALARPAALIEIQVADIEALRLAPRAGLVRRVPGARLPPIGGVGLQRLARVLDLNRLIGNDLTRIPKITLFAREQLDIRSDQD